MHAIRHLYASLLLSQGVSIKEVAEFLGHHDPAFTMKVYTHLMPDSHRRARSAVDALRRPGLGCSWDGLSGSLTP
jgi:integrase